MTQDKSINKVHKFSHHSLVKEHLIKQSELFINCDYLVNREIDTSENGQSPYAVVVTCCDSRVSPERIFGAYLGELFTIRTAGNTIGNLELGSIEYGVQVLKAKAIIVMGHTGCGAVAVALEGKADGNMQHIVDEIQLAIKSETTPSIAEELNIKHSINKIMSSAIISNFVKEDKLSILPAIYNTKSGSVNFLN